MNEAKRQGEEALEKALETVETEILSLYETARQKEAEAISAVIGELV